MEMTTDMALYQKAINEALSLQKINLDIIQANRGNKFLIKHTKPYLGVVEEMKATDAQNEVVFSLHKKSVRIHYSILESLTESIEYKDEPYMENFQTSPLLEILYEEDNGFRNFVEKKLIPEISNSKSIVLKEGERKYSGFYGPTCALDFALTPGSTGNVLNKIMRRMPLPDNEKYYAETILASKSFGMNTPYCFGWKFLKSIKEKKSKNEAVKEEIKMLKLIFEQPLATNQKIMEEVNFSSFNPESYLQDYKRRMRNTVKKAIDKEVHYGNILSIPALATGDIGHHLCQSIYDLFQDDLTFSILEGILETTEKNLRKNSSYIESLYQILSIATGSAAASLTYILESEGFDAKIIIELLTKRFQNFVRKYPFRGVALELHSVDFMDVLYRGSKILHEDKGKINNISVDFSPLIKRGIIRNPEEYIFPNYGFSSRFSALMKLSDHFCLFNLEPMSIALLTNIISLEPRKLIAPIKNCKNCAVSFIMKERCNYCERKRAI